LTPGRVAGITSPVKVTSKGQVTIPLAMRRKHGLAARCPVELIDRPEGVLIMKAGRRPRGRQILATLLRGGKVRGSTADWLRLTRGDE